MTHFSCGRFRHGDKIFCAGVRKEAGTVQHGQIRQGKRLDSAKVQDRRANRREQTTASESRHANSRNLGRFPATHSRIRLHEFCYIPPPPAPQMLWKLVFAYWKWLIPTLILGLP